MNIKVIFTGGTIGSRTDGDCVRLGGSPYVLIDNWLAQNERHTTVTSFSTDEPYSVLSENITADNYLLLAECVKKSLGGFDAVIVTHGTDTLCYTAAFLGLLFADADIPIILVSSGYPLDDSRANGMENFAAAIDFARSGYGGVYAVWHANGAAKVHLGTRIIPHAPYSDMLCSLGGEFGCVKNGRFEKNPQFAKVGKIGKSNPVFAEAALPERLDGFGKVLSLVCRPEMLCPPLSGASAVLFESYHSGTMSVSGSVARLAEKARDMNIPMFLSGAGGRNADYESVKLYRDIGINPLPAVSPSAAYVKLALAVSYGFDITQIMSVNCGGEYFLEI
jgi:L-asparaginase